MKSFWLDENTSFQDMDMGLGVPVGSQNLTEVLPWLCTKVQTDHFVYTKHIYILIVPLSIPGCGP